MGNIGRHDLEPRVCVVECEIDSIWYLAPAYASGDGHFSQLASRCQLSVLTVISPGSHGKNALISRKADSTSHCVQLPDACYALV